MIFLLEADMNALRILDANIDMHATNVVNATHQTNC
jgi:hypothetical protein